MRVGLESWPASIAALSHSARLDAVSASAIAAAAGLPALKAAPGQPWSARRVAKQLTVLQHSGLIMHFLRSRGSGSQARPPTQVALSAVVAQDLHQVAALQHVSEEMRRLGRASVASASTLTEHRKQLATLGVREVRMLADERRTLVLAKKRATIEASAFASALVEQHRRRLEESAAATAAAGASMGNGAAGLSAQARVRMKRSRQRALEGLDGVETGSFGSGELALMQRVATRAKEYELGSFSSTI